VLSNIMNYRLIVISTSFPVSPLAISDLNAQSAAALTVDVRQPKAAVNPRLHGLMTEETNYS
jgi:hypothetical protein